MNSDFKELFSCLNARRGRYLVVGGYAVIHYTEPRYTKDLDLLVDASRANARRIHLALTDFIGPLDSVGPETLARPGLWLKLGRAPTRIDILTSIKAVQFSTAWKNRVAATYGGTRIHLISRRDLIRNKRAVRRLQDLADVESLLSGSRRA